MLMMARCRLKSPVVEGQRGIAAIAASTPVHINQHPLDHSLPGVRPLDQMDSAITVSRMAILMRWMKMQLDSLLLLNSSTVALEHQDQVLLLFQQMYHPFHHFQPDSSAKICLVSPEAQQHRLCTNPMDITMMAMWTVT